MNLYPGIPPLPTGTAMEQDIAAQFSLANAPVDLTRNGTGISAQQASTQITWGIFDANGDLAIEPDSIIALDYANGKRVADYPMEEGAFSSYNRVAMPFGTRVRMAFAGTGVDDRQAFVDQVDAVFASMDLFNVVTPEVTYSNVTLEHIETHRDERCGAGMLTMDLMLREIRIGAQAQYTTQPGVTPLPASQVQSPSSASTVSGGQVQAATPTSAQQQIDLATVA